MILCLVIKTRMKGVGISVGITLVIIVIIGINGLKLLVIGRIGRIFTNAFDFGSES